MAFEFDPNLKKRIESGVDTSQGVTLPFHAPVFWAVNGDSRNKKAADASYFGGWATKADDIQEATSRYNIEVPPYLTETELANKDGGFFPVYLSRHLIIAPIAFRRSWNVTLSDGKVVRKEHYTNGEKARAHVQLLALMGYEVAEKQYAPLCPVMLSAKGYQASNLSKAVHEWFKHTSEQRRILAPDVPANCFYMAIGTFGEREVVQVGQKGAQSPITPIRYFPAEMNQATLERLYVGPGAAEMMADYLDKAQEWLNAWKGKGTNQGVTDVSEEYSPEPF